MMDNKMNDNKGFTVIELMAVVAIVSILAVVALAAYSDYVIRSKVSEAMGFAAEAKTGVSEYYYNNNKVMPRNNSQAGLPPPESYEDKYNYIRRLELSSSEPYGTITITFKLDGTKADNKLLQLIPNTAAGDGILYWECIPPATDGISVSQVPPNCRG
jgi:type IV pilus assembly protein PilA